MPEGKPPYKPYPTYRKSSINSLANAIAGVKRRRIGKDTLPLKGCQVGDQVMACRLHTPRVAFRNL
jgi:hypothetical protein